jgi:hypothetical protein
VAEVSACNGVANPIDGLLRLRQIADESSASTSTARRIGGSNAAIGNGPAWGIATESFTSTRQTN